MTGELTSLSAFVEGWALFREPTLAGAMAGALLGVLGVYVVLRRMVFLSAAVSQTAGLGVALSFWLGAPWLPPAAGATLLTLAAVLFIATDRSAGAGRRDALLGVTFLLGSAGTLVAGNFIKHELQDIDTLLFGVAVAVLPEDFSLLAWTTAGLLLLHAWCWRGFAAISFDPDGAAVRSMPVRLLDLALLASLALAVAVTTFVLGALPAFAFSILPALAALRLATNVPQTLVIAGLLGAAAGGGGYVVSFLLALPVGPVQTLTAAALFAVTVVVGAAVPSGPRGHA